MFKAKELQVTVETNLKVTEFLDVILNLNTGTYRPFTKPNNELKYVHVDSNHPPHIKKQLPKMISQRLSELSSSKEIFDEVAPQYNKAVKKAGYTEEMLYEEPTTKKKRGRNRKVT